MLNRCVEVAVGWVQPTELTLSLSNKAYLMLKKIGRFYLAVASTALLLGLIGKVTGSDTDMGLGLEILATLLGMFLIYTSPIWLVVLLLLAFGKPLKKLFNQAERFHAGDN
jgi:hypothetical protein